MSIIQKSLVFKDHFIRYRKGFNVDLTYIVGARCKDGVVMIADKKITIDEGADYTFAKKIFQPYETVIIGAAGATGQVRSFQARLIQEIEEFRRTIEKDERELTHYETQQSLLLITERTMQQQLATYREQYIRYDIDVLLANRLTNVPELFHFNSQGMPEPVMTNKAIGHGEPYGSIVLKLLWKKYNGQMHMDTFAKLGCLIIKYIQDMRLDNSVGFDEENNDYPQIWKMPNVPLNENDSEEQVRRMFEAFKIEELQDYRVKEFLKDSDQNITKIKDAIMSINL